MKECPVCKSRSFDDARTCFGCLYDFSSGGAHSAAKAPPVPVAIMPPSFVIRIKPELESSGQYAWTCSVDLANGTLT